MCAYHCSVSEASVAGLSNLCEYDPIMDEFGNCIGIDITRALVQLRKSVHDAHTLNLSHTHLRAHIYLHT
jgi:hypothetical protein